MIETLESVISALPKEQQDAIAQQTMKLVAEEMSLRELRKARERSQQAVGEILDINQAAVSKIERQTDMYISTLRSFIEAMGGELEIIAHFPDRAPIIINQFEELAWRLTCVDQPADLRCQRADVGSGVQVQGSGVQT